MKHKKNEVTWPDLWSQVQTAIMRHNAPDDVKLAADPGEVGWNYGDDKFYLFCKEELYRWLEVPSAPDEESNLRFIKPILWPMMQKYNCKDLYYRIIKTQLTIKH